MFHLANYLSVPICLHLPDFVRVRSVYFAQLESNGMMESVSVITLQIDGGWMDGWILRFRGMDGSTDGLCGVLGICVVVPCSSITIGFLILNEWMPLQASFAYLGS
jgi:hypothetical protein